MTDSITIVSDSGWTIDTLKVHFDQRFEAADGATKLALDAAKEAVGAALIAAEKAVDKQEIADDKRFHVQNEFRDQLKDQADTLMPRIEATLRMDALQAQATQNANLISTIRTHEAVVTEQKNENWNGKAPVIISAISAGIAIIAIIVALFIATHTHAAPTTPVAPTPTVPAAVAPASVTPAAIILSAAPGLLVT